MSFETMSLLLNWMQLGALLAIVFRLGHTFELIANTQRELRRAIHHLGELRVAELGIDNAFSRPGARSFRRLDTRRALQRALWIPTIWPVRRYKSGIQRSLAFAGGGVSVSAWASDLLALGFALGCCGSFHHRGAPICTG